MGDLTDYMSEWLNTHRPDVAEYERRLADIAAHPGEPCYVDAARAIDPSPNIIDADLLPGSSRTPVGDEDPHGHEADRAAADAWWSQVEPDSGRWAS